MRHHMPLNVPDCTRILLRSRFLDSLSPEVRTPLCSLLEAWSATITTSHRLDVAVKDPEQKETIVERKTDKKETV